MSRNKDKLPKSYLPIDWLLDKFPGRFRNALINECSEEIKYVRKMHRDQILEAWEDGHDSSSSRNAEQYYFETYEAKKK